VHEEDGDTKEDHPESDDDAANGHADKPRLAPEGDPDEVEDSSSSGEDDNSAEKDSDDAETNSELRKRLGQTLGINAIDHNNSSDDSEEDLMDDEQMMAIDEQLADLFRSRVNEDNAKKSMFPSCLTQFLLMGLLFRCRRATRSNTFQKSSFGPHRHFCQAAASIVTCAVLHLTLAQACHGDRSR
jgi:hypothetical protein